MDLTREDMLNHGAKDLENIMKQLKLIFVIEDEEDIARLIQYNLTLSGYEVKTFLSGEDGLRALEKEKPDLLLLDIMLPGIDGFEICRRLKANKSLQNLPIIMLTARGEEQDVVNGLELGADDYITKPFSPKVLAARVQTILKRHGKPTYKEDEEIRIANCIIHPGRHQVRIDEKNIDLTNSEFKILHCLTRKPGWVFTRNQIVNAIRGINFAVTERTVDFQMVGLRRKLGDFGDRIETVRGVGYRFRE